MQPAQSMGSQASLRRNRIAILIGLASIVFISLSPVLSNGFVSYDDADYVTANPHVNSGLSWTNFAWAFTNTHASNWHPLTWISHQLDVSLSGLNPAGPHLVNLLLHTITALLLFVWLASVIGREGRSAFVALMFGVHPLHVESVAWVAERKDVLSGLFLMLTLLAYAGYVRRGGARRYALMVALFACGLLSKPILITLPFLLLLLDWWPLNRLANSKGGRSQWRPLTLEKVPLFALSALCGVAAIWSQAQSGSVISIDQLPLGLRLSNAAVSYVRYLGKTIWPVDLAVFYPYPVSGIPAWLALLCAVALGAATFAIWRLRRDRPWLAVGWSWYLVALLPVIGIVQVGVQAMADRYMYLPMTGLWIAVAWELGEFAERFKTFKQVATAPGEQASEPLQTRSSTAQQTATVAAALAIGACCLLSWRQTHVWKNGLTLFTHAIQVTNDNFVAHDNLGVELDRLGRPEEALAEYRETLRIKPNDRNGEQNYALANFAKGERLFMQRKSAEALPAFREGLRYRPGNALAHTYVGLALTDQNQLAAALQELRLALSIDPSLAKAYMGLGVALARSGQLVEAERALESSLQRDRTVEVYYDLGLVQSALGKNAEALASYKAALAIDPDYAPALEALRALSASRPR